MATSQHEKDKFTWSCPVCMEPLGSEGMVPVALASCKLSVHLICLDCYEGMKASSRSMVCPICRDPIVGKVLPITDLVDPDDGLAGAKLESRFPRRSDTVDQYSETLASLKAKVAGFDDMYKVERERVIAEAKQRVIDLKKNRINYIVTQVKNFLKEGHPPGSWDIWQTKTPSFEEAKYNFSVKDKRVDRMRMLNELYAVLNNDVVNLFTDSRVKVRTMPYTPDEMEDRKTVIHYMRLNIILPQ